MGLMPSGGLALRLVDYIGQNRDMIRASTLRSPEVPWGENPGEAAFVRGFLDRLCAELESGDREVLERWAEGGGHRALPAAENARLLVLLCAAISAGFAAERGQSREIIGYLALRGSELANRVDAFERKRKLAQPADLSAAASREDAVRSFLAVLEDRDKLTCEHSRAVGAWSGRLAKALGMTAEAREFAVICGSVHDVGKINTPQSILLKAGPLSDDEWVEMRAHSEAGAKMIELVAPIRDAAHIVRAHHERVDGTGYPDGLAGEAIPLVARIVAVADSFHAMITKRPYREAMSIATVIEVLNNGRGVQWDEQVVQAMIGVVRPAAAQVNLRALRLA
jgi:HD-GYP domain-containing protein (c-di-GMP phosphodiesterase class II)